MKAIKTIFLSIGACSILTACAAAYIEPPNTSPHANFIFKKTISGKLLFRGDEPIIVTYQTYADPACTQPVPAANFSPTSAEQKKLRFAANTPQRMVVNMVTKTGDITVQNGVVVPSGPVKQYNCIGLAGFTPIAGRTYELSVTTTEKADICVLGVVDTSTGEGPSDLVHSKQEVCDS